MTQVQLDEKAQRILGVAFELAEEGGFDAVRLRDVADQAGVALGTLYSRFSSKEEMLVAALDESTQTFEAVISDLSWSDTDPVQRIADLLVLAARALFNRPNFGRAVLRAAAAGGEATTHRIYSHQATMRRLMLRCLGHANEAAVDAQTLQGLRWLQQLSFASLLGWANGMLSEDEVIENLQAATERLIGDAS